MDGKQINWKWLLAGGAVVVVVLVLVMKSGSTSGPATSSTPPTDTNVTSNTGTPPASNNSLFGFTDPATGIQWILDSATEAMVTLPNGSGLPPTYTSGTSLLPSTAVVPMNMGGPVAYTDALTNWKAFMGFN